MPSDLGAGETELPDLRSQLDAERAAVEHWRRIALQRSEEFAALSRRPTVRALLAVERRVAPVVTRPAPLGAGCASGPSGWRWVPVLCVGPVADVHRRGLVAPAPVQPGPPRRMAIVVVGSEDPAWVGALSPSVEVTRVAEPRQARATLARAIKASAPDLVGAMAATTEPLDVGWLDRLAAAIDGSVVAAVPLVVHPRRPPWRATPHDGLVRAAGVGLRLDGEGTPWAEAARGGDDAPGRR